MAIVKTASSPARHQLATAHATRTTEPYMADGSYTAARERRSRAFVVQSASLEVAFFDARSSQLALGPLAAPTSSSQAGIESNEDGSHSYIKRVAIPSIPLQASHQSFRSRSAPIPCATLHPRCASVLERLRYRVWDLVP